MAHYVNWGSQWVDPIYYSNSTTFTYTTAASSNTIASAPPPPSAPKPRPRPTNVDRLLAEVESYCEMGRAA